MKRFYKETGVDAGEDGFRVLLDGKPMRTPAKAVLVVPTRALAEAIAAEWAAVPDKAEINAAHLPLTRLAATGIDRVVARRDEVIADTAKYAASDLLCYRAAGPDSLIGLQRERWDPLLAWAAERHGARLVTAEGIGFVEQAAEARARLHEAVSAHGDLALSALYNLTHTAGSVVIALAVSDGRLDAAGAFAAAQTDELYQVDRWGDDPIAEKQREGVRRDIEACARFLSLLENARLRG
ncbi:MAG: ATPase [Reyranella sp.]|uniref:ATP12 family chaperone protein n=1 Tax=Reyranella sp. TaxID=1929291 RepID=UPI00121C1B1E|nr:ATP12 family protein [Reyranella sp.]TAJ90891.1 MAG: ATPase [Reyranella sp.]TBR30441.1 MAG: ATPase [Reyranella sp.]